MNLGYMKKVVRRSWDSLPMPNTMIARVNALGQGIPNNLGLLYRKIRPIGGHSLPFMRLPVILNINIVLNNVNILVYLPTTAGI